MRKGADSMPDNDVPLSARGATVHGVYDYLLGGADHLHADREVGNAIEERFPSVAAHVRAARMFHVRAARWSAENGVTRLIAAGVAGWKPGMRNLCDAAREVAPGAEAVYVHRLPETHARARAVLLDAGLGSVRARVEFPDEILSAAPVTAMLAEGKPVALHLAMTLHFAPPGEAGKQVARYAAALPSGSVVAVSVAIVDDSPRASELLALFTPAPVCRYTAADVAAWLEQDAGMELVPPGVRDVRALPGGAWAPGERRAPGMTAGALAVKP